MPKMQLAPNQWPQPMLNSILKAVQPFAGARAAAEKAIADAAAAEAAITAGTPVSQLTKEVKKLVQGEVKHVEGVDDVVIAVAQTADVHVDEVANWQAAGWQVVQ